MHGTLRVFFVLTMCRSRASPLLLADPDRARYGFSRFNGCRFGPTFVAFLFLSARSSLVRPPLSGWTAYAPRSAVGGCSGPGQGRRRSPGRLPLGSSCIGQLLGSVDFTHHVSRSTHQRHEPDAHADQHVAWFITSCMGLTRLRGLVACVCALILDHVAVTTSYSGQSGHQRPTAASPSGGATLLLQHLFWFFGHHRVYIAIVPGMVSWPTF